MIGTRVNSAAAGLLVMAAVAACSGDRPPIINPPDPPPVPVAARIQFTPDTVAVLPGVSLQVAAIVRDSAGVQITGAPVLFSSRDAQIASTTPSGMVTAVAVGKTYIVAQSGALEDSVPVRVITTQAAAVILSLHSVSMKPGDKLLMTAVAYDSAGTRLPDGNVQFRSLNPVVATATLNGEINAVAAGTAWIIAEAGPARDSLRVTVANPTYRIDISPAVVSLRAGESKAVTATVRNDQGQPVSTPAPQFTSTNGAVFTTAGSVVTAVANGTAWLRVTAGTSAESVAVNVFDPFTMTMRAPLTVSGRPFGIAVSGDNLYVTQLDGNSYTRFSVSGLTRLGSTPIGGLPLDVAFAEDGSRAYLVNMGTRSVSFADVASGTVPIWHYINPDTPHRIAISPDGVVLYVTTQGGGLIFMDRASGEVLQRIGFANSPANGIALSPDGQTLYVTANGGTLARFSTTTNALLGTVNLGPSLLQDIVVSPDGRELYIADEAGLIKVIDVATLTQKGTIGVRDAFGLRLTPDGKYLVATISLHGDIAIVERQSRVVVQTFLDVGHPRRIAFDAPFTTIFVADEHGRVHVIR